MKQPQCLHIPPLYEGESAQISWGVMESDTNHIIERVFNETFSQASTGYTWDNIATINASWSQYDQEDLTWQQIENRLSMGQSWERLDYNGFSWAEIEAKFYTWQQLESLEVNFEIFRGAGTDCSSFEEGSAWYELEALNKTWSDIESMNYSWDDWEKMKQFGLSWNSIEAKWLSFHEWESKGLTFAELDRQMDAEEHRGMTDFIRIGSKNATYRIKAYNSAGDESDYLTTSQLPVIPIFYRDSEAKYPVESGKSYCILLTAADVHGLNRVNMNLRYDSNILELVDMSAQSDTKVLIPGNYQKEYLELYSHFNGNMWFRSTRPVNADECFSGIIALVKFTAKQSGTATVSLY